ncbi:pyridoxamine 5'-phosphate oxidase family protein [Seohaeicola zhoushanensis]
MATQYDSLNADLRDFILRQHIFFTASATASSRVNLTPREIGALRILDDNTVCYLDRTGSGNETAAHMLADGRLTIMVCAFAARRRSCGSTGTGNRWAGTATASAR